MIKEIIRASPFSGLPLSNSAPILHKKLVGEAFRFKILFPKFKDHPFILDSFWFLKLLNQCRRLNGIDQQPVESFSWMELIHWIACLGKRSVRMSGFLWHFFFFHSAKWISHLVKPIEPIQKEPDKLFRLATTKLIGKRKKLIDRNLLHNCWPSPNVFVIRLSSNNRP